MKLSKKIHLLKEYFEEDIILENNEDVIPINEDTESEKKGYAAGKAAQAVVVVAVFVFIAKTRARIRLAKKEAYYSKEKPKREMLVADKKVLTKKYAAEESENIKKLAGKLIDKVKAEVKKKKAAYAAKVGKSQSELSGDKTLTNLDKVKDEKIKKVEAAVKEKLKQKQDKEQLDLDRKIEDWDRVWKKKEEKWDPSEFFNKIAGRQGLGGVLAAWEQWKIDEDRKIYDKTLKYELKQIQQYVEKDEDIKAIMANRKAQKAKMEEEWKKRGLSITERLKKAEELDKELEKEESELKNEFPNLDDAKNAKVELDNALSDWSATYGALEMKDSITNSQKEELKKLAKDASKAMSAMSDEYYEAITGGKDYSKLKDADKEYKESLDKGQKEFLSKVQTKSTEEDIEKIKNELEDAKKDLSDVKSTKDPDKDDLLDAEIEVLKKAEELASAEGNEKERKDYVKKIATKQKELDAIKNPNKKLESKSYNMKITKKIKSLNEWNIFIENEMQQHEAPKQDIETSAPETDLSMEIDTILDKLKELEDGIEEDLKSIESEKLNEAGALAAAGGATVNFIKDFMRSRKIKSNQVKANAIKLQKAKTDIQKKEVEPEQKEKLDKKIDKFKETIDKIEGQIDQMAEGPMSQRVKSTYRIQGEMEVAKVLAKGGADNSKRIASLQKQLKDQVAATKKLADENKDAIAKMKKDQAKKDGEAQKEETPKKEPEVGDTKAKSAEDKAKSAKDTDDTPKPDPKKQKAAADKINKDNDKKIKAAGDDQKKAIKDTEDEMKKQNDDTMKKAQKDIDNMNKNIDKIRKNSAKKKDGPKAPPPIPGKDKKKDNKKVPKLPPIPGKDKKKDNKKVPKLPPIPGKDKKKDNKKKKDKEEK